MNTSKPLYGLIFVIVLIAIGKNCGATRKPESTTANSSAVRTPQSNATSDASFSAGRPQGVSNPPPPLPKDPATVLIGSWRWSGGDGVSSTFVFHANGMCTFYVASTNPLVNIPAAYAGDVYGRWSIRNGFLMLEFTGASQPAMAAVFRGRAMRSPLRFRGDDAVDLTGVELDNQTRTYTRVN